MPQVRTEAESLSTDAHCNLIFSESFILSKETQKTLKLEKVVKGDSVSGRGKSAYVKAAEVLLTGDFLSMGLMMNFLSLKEMFLISLQGKPIFGVNLGKRSHEHERYTLIMNVWQPECIDDVNDIWLEITCIPQHLKSL